MKPPTDLHTRGRVLHHGMWLYDAAQPLVTFGRERAVVRRAVDMLAPRDGERILDVGCGTGIVTQEVARRTVSGTAVGVDASETMIRIAQRKRGGGRCQFEAALAERLPFGESSFDGAISALFFHHVPLDLKRQSAHEMWRVLRPGGRAVVVDLDRPWNLFGTLYGTVGWVLFRQPEIHENLQGVMTGVLEDAGFRNVTAERGALGCIRIWQGVKAP